MKEIGGYFELELNNGKEFHKNSIKLNSGRNALEYVLRANNYKKIFLPYYTCDVLLEPINKLNIDVEYYNINKELEPIFDLKKIKTNEVFLYTNYFGIKSNYAKELETKIANIIIDSAQSFFSKYNKNTDAFYSPRKYFGVPDGAYLYSSKRTDIFIEKGFSSNNISHLMQRLDADAAAGYHNFLTNEDNICNQPIKSMSKLTEKLLSSINYNDIINIRRENYHILNELLNSTNELNYKLSTLDVPMVYPYWNKKIPNLKSFLIKNNIFVATYWPNVLNWCKIESFEYQLVNETAFLPIDQRYNKNDMLKIVNLIKSIK